MRVCPVCRRGLGEHTGAERVACLAAAQDGVPFAVVDRREWGGFL